MALPNLTLRSLTPTVGTTKGSALTFAEMDTNLINLGEAVYTVIAGTGTEVSQADGNVTVSATQMPQVSAANVTLALTDAGKHFYATATSPTTLTIPVNSSVAFGTGTVISIINQGTGNITVDKGSATLYLAGNATSDSRTVTSYGMATLIKVATDTWFINGNGVV